MHLTEPKIQKKKVPKALQDSFVDPEMIYATVISGILHIVVFLAIGGLIWEHYSEGYKALLKELHKRPDIILYLKKLKPH